MSSKIKVDTIENVAGSGNVSLGSGHNLVVPGDLTVDTNVLKVDASNNRVGVNITSPTHPLSVNGQIKSTGANGETVQLQTSSQYTGISFIGSDGTRDAIIDYDHTGGVMGIKAHTSAHKISMTTGGYTERLGIDADGRVTMPGQPSFRVGGNNANWVSVTSGNTSIIEFDGNVYHNVGSHYSTANDRFTAPVAGRYLIGYHAYVRNNAAASDGTSAYGYVRLKKNGNNLSYLNNIFGYANHTDNDIQMTLQTVIELAANDYMQVALSAVGGTVQHYGNSSQFYGQLLS